MENGVTGLNNLKKHKTQAQKEATRRQEVHELPAHAESVAIDSLVLISVNKESSEGEMAVGLARAMESCESGDCQFKWYVRKEWCRKPRRHAWSKSPTFRLAAHPTNQSKCYITREAIEKVLPLQVVVTANCKRDHPRLEAGCVRNLREFCMQRDLMCSERSVQDDESTSSDDDEHAPRNNVPQKQGEARDLRGWGRVADRVRANKRNLTRRVVIESDSSEAEEEKSHSTEDQPPLQNNIPQQEAVEAEEGVRVSERVSDRVKRKPRRR